MYALCSGKYSNEVHMILYVKTKHSESESNFHSFLHSHICSQTFLFNVVGCSLNFHKRCVIKIPNNCTSATGRGRRPSTLLVPRSPSDTGSTVSLPSASDENAQVSWNVCCIYLCEFSYDLQLMVLHFTTVLVQTW